VAVSAVTRKVAELLRFEADRRRIAISMDLPEELPCIAADSDQLEQVLVNVLMNSLDACKPDGHVDIKAKLARASDREKPDERLEIIVADDGVGIIADNLHKIFDPFFTTKKRGQGTGLGLTMVAQIVRSHGANIEVASEPDQGTRVTLLWPTAENGGSGLVV
jgi:signal transduction histidine kinase